MMAAANIRTGGADTAIHEFLSEVSSTESCCGVSVSTESLATSSMGTSLAVGDAMMSHVVAVVVYEKRWDGMQFVLW